MPMSNDNPNHWTGHITITQTALHVCISPAHSDNKSTVLCATTR